MNYPFSDHLAGRHPASAGSGGPSAADQATSDVGRLSSVVSRRGLAAGGVLADMTVQNLVDRDPPFFDGLSGDTDGSTFGRLFLLGLRRNF